MIFLDSWVWLEFVFDGDAAEEAESAIQRADTPEEGGLIAPTVITELSYPVRTVEDAATADEVVSAMLDYYYIESVPVIDEIAAYAAKLRFKYYDRGDRELSYADAIHLATAVVHDDCRALYSGDPDFAEVNEIQTIVL